MVRRVAALSKLTYLWCVLWSCLSTAAAAQQAPSTPRPPEAPDVTFHASTNLVLVDVIALKADTQRPDNTLNREDLQILDNGHAIPVKTFDTGAASRPLALWFVVQCTMKDWDNEGSALFRGRVDLLKPALLRLGNADVVAVAHWCDDGQSSIDVSPSSDADKAIVGVEEVLAPVYEPRSHDRPGELALQKVLQLIVDSTRSLPHDTVPVLVFLYGDYSSIPAPKPMSSSTNSSVLQLLSSASAILGLRTSIRSSGNRGPSRTTLQLRPAVSISPSRPRPMLPAWRRSSTRCIFAMN